MKFRTMIIHEYEIHDHLAMDVYGTTDPKLMAQKDQYELEKYGLESFMDLEDLKFSVEVVDE